MPLGPGSEPTDADTALLARSVAGFVATSASLTASKPSTARQVSATCRVGHSVADAYARKPEWRRPVVGSLRRSRISLSVTKPDLQRFASHAQRNNPRLRADVQCDRSESPPGNASRASASLDETAPALGASKSAFASPVGGRNDETNETRTNAASSANPTTALNRPQTSSAFAARSEDGLRRRASSMSNGTPRQGLTDVSTTRGDGNELELDTLPIHLHAAAGRTEGKPQHPNDEDETTSLLVKPARVADEADGSAEEPPEDHDSQDTDTNLNKRLLAGAALFGTVVAAVVIGWVSGGLSPETFASLAEWFQSLGPFAAVAYALVYFALELLAVPATPLTLGSGYLFGALKGTAVVSVAATAAASASFLIARYGLRDYITKLARRYPKFRALDRAIGREGFKFVFLLRLSPLLPFAISNYLYGLTSVSFRGYVTGSWLGMLPGTIAYVSAGATVGALTDLSANKGSMNPFLLGLGVLATIAVLVQGGRAASAAIEEAAMEDEAV